MTPIIKNCHKHACCRHCSELSDTRTLSTHRCRVLVRHRFSLPAYTWFTIYLLDFWPLEWGLAYMWDSLYTSIYGINLSADYAEDTLNGLKTDTLNGLKTGNYSIQKMKFILMLTQLYIDQLCWCLLMLWNFNRTTYIWSLFSLLILWYLVDIWY